MNMFSICSSIIISERLLISHIFIQFSSISISKLYFCSLNIIISEFSSWSRILLSSDPPPSPHSLSGWDDFLMVWAGASFLKESPPPPPFSLNILIFGVSWRSLMLSSKLNILKLFRLSQTPLPPVARWRDFLRVWAGASFFSDPPPPHPYF